MQENKELQNTFYRTPTACHPKNPKICVQVVVEGWYRDKNWCKLRIIGYNTTIELTGDLKICEKFEDAMKASLKIRQTEIDNKNKAILLKEIEKLK